MTNAAPLLNTPADRQTFDIWAFSLRMNIVEINDAIEAQQKVRLPEYPIYPVPYQDLGAWLLQISEAIGNIATQLKIQSVDIENVNLDDDNERQDWANSIFVEVNQARIVLKI